MIKALSIIGRVLCAFALLQVGAYAQAAPTVETTTKTKVKDDWKNTLLSTDARDNGVILAQTVTYKGEDSGIARIRIKDGDVEVKYQETSKNNQNHSNNEKVDIVAFINATIGFTFGEARTLSLGDSNKTVSLQKTYTNPVFFTQVASNEGSDPVDVVITSTSNNSVTLILLEPQNDDGHSKDETVSLVVLEAGIHTLADGTRLFVGTKDLTTTSYDRDGFTTINLATLFSGGDITSNSIVIAKVQALRGVDFGNKDEYVGTRIIRETGDVNIWGRRAFEMRLMLNKSLEGTNSTADTKREVGILFIDRSDEGEIAFCNNTSNCPNFNTCVPISSLCDKPLCDGQDDSNDGCEAENSWLGAALGLQNRLDRHVPVRRAMMAGTHNSFNNFGNGYDLDVNHMISIRAQLESGIRVLEYDIHKFGVDHDIPPLRLCHTFCSATDMLARRGFEIVQEWFAADPSRYDNEVVMIMIEDDGDGDYGKLKDFIKNKLGDILYKPPYNCANFSAHVMDVSKEDILAAGKNVIILSELKGSSCNTQNLGDFIFFGRLNKKVTHAENDVFIGYPVCEFTKGNNSANNINDFLKEYWRSYNDGTLAFEISEGFNEFMSRDDVEDMAGCAIGGMGPERMQYDDQRLKKHIWSWDVDEPNNFGGGEDCALHKGDGRFNDLDCSNNHRYACKFVDMAGLSIQKGDYASITADDFWKITSASGPWSGGAAACQSAYGDQGYAFSLPVNGYENNLLKDVKTASGVSDLWLNYTDQAKEGDWEPVKVDLLVAHVGFDASSSGSLDVTDDSFYGGQASLAVNDATTAPGVTPQWAASVDGSQVIKLDWEQEFGAQATLAAWFKESTAAPMGDKARIVQFSYLNDPEFNTAIGYNSSGKLKAWCTGDFTSSDPGEVFLRQGEVTAPSLYHDGAWHHVAYVLDGVVAKLYVDGGFVASSSTACQNINNASLLAIGTNLEGHTPAFNGVIDDVRVYKTALSLAEISALHNVLPTVFSDQATVVVTEGTTAINSGTVFNPAGAALTLSASIGTVVDNGDGTWGWSFQTSSSSETQTVTITATRSSDGAASDTTFDLNVTVVNSPPVFMVGGDVTVEEDSGAYGALQATGIDDGNPETVQALTFQVSNDKNSLFSVQPLLATNGTLTFTPAPDAHGSALVTVTLTDDATVDGTAITTDPQTFTITVTPVNDPPVATNNSYTHDEDTQLAGNVITDDTGAGVDSDVDGDGLSVFSITDVSHGVLALYADGSFTYDPNLNYCGPDGFTYVITDDPPITPPPLTSTTATVSITVACVNDLPVVTSVDPGAQTSDYSDFIGTVTIMVEDVDDTSTTLTESNEPPLSAAGLSLTARGCTVIGTESPAEDGSTCTWTYDGQVLDPGDNVHGIVFTPADGDGDGSTDTHTLTIEPEDATVLLDSGNDVAVEVATEGGNSGVFSLFFAAWETTDPEDFPHGGTAEFSDLNKMVPYMTLIPVGPGGPVNAVVCAFIGDLPDYPAEGYGQVALFECVFDDVPVNTYEVVAAVDGADGTTRYYAGSDEEVFVVYDPSLGFITGGGWFYWPGTEDPSMTTCGPDGYAGDKTNFGFNMKYNKKRTNIRGSLLLMRHTVNADCLGTGNYKVKSNALDGLSIGDGTDGDGDYGWAAFSGKSTFRKPGLDNEGNNPFLVYIEDHNERGCNQDPSDEVWIEVKDQDGVVVLEVNGPDSEPAGPDPATDGDDEPIECGNIVVPH